MCVDPKITWLGRAGRWPPGPDSCAWCLGAARHWGVLTRAALRAPGTAEGVPASRGVSPAPSTEKAAGRTHSKGQMAGESRYGEMSLEWPVISWFTGTNTEHPHSDISSEVTRAWGPQDRNGGAPGARSHE